MSMPAPSSGQTYYTPRRSNGCLWGCLIVLLIIVLPPALLGGYGAWFLYDGYRHSPVLKVVNEHFNHQLSRADILHTYSGVRPLCNDESDNPSAVTRDYTLALSAAQGEAPLLSVFGGKLTTYRKLAESAMAELQPFFTQMRGSWTAGAPLPGGESMTTAPALVDALVAATGGKIHTVRVTGPLSRMKVDAPIGILGDGFTAVIEMSSASGLYLLDPEHRQWHATSTLKPLSGWCTRALAATDVTSVDDKDFTADIAAMTAHPYARLKWLTHLVCGEDRLDDSLDPNGRYKLARWPQSEREFPRHFRIATVMLKQLATLDEIAAQSGATIADVANFINAYQAIGYVECDAPERPQEEARRGGLFARMKKASAAS